MTVGPGSDIAEQCHIQTSPPSTGLTDLDCEKGPSPMTVGKNEHRRSRSTHDKRLLCVLPTMVLRAARPFRIESASR